MTSNSDFFWKLLEPEYIGAMMFCRKLMGDRDRGDDLYQDGLVIALRKFSDLRDPASFRPWLYRVLISTFKSTVRRSWWRRKTLMANPVVPSPVGHDPINAHAARRWVERAMAPLSADERAQITLFELEDWTIDELAQLYGKRAGAIKTRLFRIRQKMKKALLKQTGMAQSSWANNDGKVEDQCAVTKPGLD